jgi:hypothetical protein
MADQEVIKHVKHAIDVARSDRRWTHKLQEILLEIAIIVFAVSLSIWLHNWSEGSKDREEEREFLVGLKADLQADIAEMQSDRNGFLKDLQGEEYFFAAGNGGAYNLDSLKQYQQLLFSYTDFFPRVSRFEALRGSGRLGIIRDKELLVHIADLYTKDVPMITRVNDYLNDLRKNQLLPIFWRYAKLKADGTGVVNWDEVLHMPEMRIMILSLQTAGNNVKRYGEAIRTSEMIIKEIDKDLK